LKVIAMTTTLAPLGLREVRDLVQPIAPTASVYLGPRQDPADDAELEMLLRRRHIAQHLAEQGAGNDTIDAVVGYLAKLPEYADNYAVFACANQIVLAQRIDGTVETDTVAYAAPPKVAPLLNWLQQHPAYVLAHVDRAGAELTTVAAGSVEGRQLTVVGSDDDIRRRYPGGGQLPRMRRRAEDSWRHNTQAVADAVREQLDRVGGDLVLVTGDPRAIPLMTESLRDAGCRYAIRHLPTGHTAGAGDRDRHRLAGLAAAAYAADRTAALLTQLTAERNSTAVEGAEAVLASLAEGSARVLFVRDDPDDRRLAWFGSELLCAADRPVGISADPGRLTDVVTRAALLTRAEIRTLTAAQAAGIEGGIAALVRHN
jgi:Bacterial archaeo-eukaryotic release factor family 2